MISRGEVVEQFGDDDDITFKVCFSTSEPDDRIISIRKNNRYLITYL